MTRARLLCFALVAAIASVVLVAAPASAVTGQVSGVVRDAAGAPVAGLTVQARQVNPAPSTVTAADGSYTLAIQNSTQIFLRVSGTYTGADYFADTDRFFMSGGDRIENLTVPLGAMAHISVKEFDGTPSVNARVRPEAPLAVTTTSTGLDMVSRLAGTTCYTDSAGGCEFHALRGGRIGAPFLIAGEGRPEERFGVLETPGPFASAEFVLAHSFAIRGALRFSDGSPIAGVTVYLDGADAESATTAVDGSYTIRSATGLDHASGIRLVMKGTIHDDGRTGSVTVTTDLFSVNGSRTQNVVLPRLGSHVIEVDESDGGPVERALVWMPGISRWSGPSPEGPGISASLLSEKNEEEMCATTAAGTCEYTVFREGISNGFRVTPPGGSEQTYSAVSFDGVSTRTIARLTGYATTASAGSVAGRVLGTTDGDAHRVDLAALAATSVDLPAGMQAVAGQIHYELRTGIGSGAPLTLELPEGAHPNALLVLGPDGRLSEKTSNVEIIGKRVRFVVWDATQDDPDHQYDGVVAGTVIPVVREPLTVTTTSVPAAAVGKPYTFALSGTGPVPPYTWGMPDGSLPEGLSMSPGGVISGTPINVGSSTFTVRMTDSTGSASQGMRTFTLTVSRIAVVTTGVPDAYVGGSYSFALKHSGGALPAWQIVSGALPPGIKLSNGALSGTPTSPGTYAFSVTVKSGSNTSPPQELILTVRPMDVVTTSLPDAPVGATYSQKLTTNGGKGTLSWSIAGGALPGGMTLSSAGVISGRPTAVGTYTVTARVSDQSVPKQIAERSQTITVTPMTITTSELPDGTKGRYYAFKLAASGGKPTLAWSVVGGALPTGLTLSAAGNISGYPKAPGTWTFTVRLLDASTPKNQATRTFTLTVN